MLLGIPKVIDADLLQVLMRMGHGDEIVIADANFPAYSIARHTAHGRPIVSAGAGMVEMVCAILKLMPLDEAVRCPAGYMDRHEGMDAQPIHLALLGVLNDAGCGAERVEPLSRFAFYERAKQAYAIVLTGETARFGNAALKKGVVKQEGI